MSRASTPGNTCKPVALKTTAGPSPNDGLFLGDDGMFHTPPLPQSMRIRTGEAGAIGLMFPDNQRKPAGKHQAPPPPTGAAGTHATPNGKPAEAPRIDAGGGASEAGTREGDPATTPPDPEALSAFGQEALQPFLTAVLGPAGVPAGDSQHALFAIKHGGTRGWWPCSFKEFLEEFGGNPGRACYISTSIVTMGTHPRTAGPALRHGNKHFVEQRFFVLDDIGTRVKHADLPAIFQSPTTIVETSEGNYQYAYRWTCPITDLALAQEIIRAVYAAGATHGWDQGGALPIKFVRLPAGVNGKRPTKNGKPGFATAKTWFPCRMLECHPERSFDPVEVAMAVGHDVNAPKNSTGRELSALRRDEGHHNVTCDGIVDTFLDRLETVGEVIGESPGGIYQDVKCPWADEHTDKAAGTAGYKPLGVIGTHGDEDSICQRHFKCFHDSCDGRRTEDYIEYMRQRYEALFPDLIAVTDHSAKLARDWVWVSNVPGYNNGAYVRLADGTAWSISVFAEHYRGKIPGPKTKAKGRPTMATQASQFRNSPLRLCFDRAELRPDVPSWMIIDSDGRRVLNSFRRVVLKSAAYDPAFMDRWLDRHQRLYGEASAATLDGWAYKYQHPEWTGYGELGIGQVQGIGRTSFLRTYLDMWRPEYVATLPMKHLSLDWGNYQTKLLVIVNEVCASEASKFSLAEKFKEEIDSTPERRIDVNVKGGRIIEGQRVFAHWLMFSNHRDALHIPETDRRLLVADNGYKRRTAQDNAEFWEGYWNKNKEYSKTQLHYFLMSRDLSGFDPFADAPPTTMRQRMIRETSITGVAVDAVLDHWLACASAQGISIEQMMHAINQGVRRRFRGNSLPTNWKMQARRHLQSRTVLEPEYWSIKGKRDGRLWVDVGRRRDAPDGPARGWCKKQNILLIPGLQGVDVPVGAVDVDWDGLATAVDDALSSEVGIEG